MHIRMKLRENRSEIGVEETLANYPALSRTTLGGWASIGFGAATLGIAVYVARGALGYVGGTAQAPGWVLWCVAIIFMLGGVALCVHGVLDVLEARRAAADARANPDDPWRGDYAWADAASGRGMRSRDSRWWGMWGLALLVVVCMTLVSLWVSWTGPGGVVGVFLWVMSGFVVLALVLYAWVFMQRVIAVVRYGSPRVVYDEVPVRPGGTLTGRVVCARGFGSLDRVTIVLRWVEERYDKVPRSGGKDKTVIRCRGTASDVWVIEDVAAALGADERSGSGEIPIAFLIPEDAPETCASGRPARFWDLEVRGEARGVDFVHRFVVPVYG